MAKIVFGTGGLPYAIAADQATLDAMNLVQSQYDIVDVSDTIYNNVRLNKSTVSYDGSTVTENGRLQENEVTDGVYIPYDNPGNGVPVIKTALVLEKIIEDTKKQINWYLESNTNTHVSNYLSFLNSIDTSTISFPMYVSLEEYAESQGQTAFHPLQLR
jgi:hypothetical protein